MVSEFNETHLSSITELLNDEFRGSREFIPFDEERVISEIRSRHLRLLVAAENNRTLGLVATHSHENSEEHVTWLTARRGANKKVIENKLMDELEKQLDVNTIMIMIDEKSPRIPDWIDRGYILEPGFQRMSAKLDGLRPIPKVDDGITLRSLRADEEEQLITSVNKGFGWRRLRRGDLGTWKTEHPPFNENWVQIAETEQKIVSVVVARPDSDSIKYLHIKRGYLGPAATLPEHRSKHLASVLTVRAMNFLFERGMDSVRLGTSETNTSSIALLRRLGFKVEAHRKILRKNLRDSQNQTR